MGTLAEWPRSVKAIFIGQKALAVAAVLLALMRSAETGGAADQPAQLRSPPEGASISEFGTTLQWTVPGGITQQHLQVAPKSPVGPGIDTLLAGQVTSFVVPAPPGWYGLLPDMTYVWRVRTSAANTGLDANSPLWSPRAERTFRTPMATTSSVRQTSPANGASVPNVRPNLQWSAPNSLFYFELQLSIDSTFTTDSATATAAIYSALVHGGVAAPPNSYQPPADAPLQPNALYHWRVRPRVQGDGTPLPWISTFTFTTAAPPPDAPLWLKRVNQHRASAGLPPVTNNSGWAEGCRKHAEYMVKSRTIGHSEDPGSPWASPDGVACGAAANVAAGSGGVPLLPPTDADVIDAWMTGPSHGLGLVDPRLTQLAYGRHDERGLAGYRWAAALDVLRAWAPAAELRIPSPGPARWVPPT
ncbi:MAG: CAP domain-containing protein [Dehalococcoidia bacterium]|nr:CAP domain-containing protein [Dehalococcoidia bacterium]